MFDFDMSPLSSLRYVRFQGNCTLNGKELPLYYFELAEEAFDHHLNANSEFRHGAQILWDTWVLMLQAMVHDFCLVNDDDDEFALKMKVTDWMGPRNVICVLKTEDHHICPVSPPNDCDVVHSILFPPEIMWTPKWSPNSPPSIALTVEDLRRARTVLHFV